MLLRSFLGIGLGFPALLPPVAQRNFALVPLVLASLVPFMLLVPFISRASDQIIYFTSTDPPGANAGLGDPAALIFAAVAAAPRTGKVVSRS